MTNEETHGKFIGDSSKVVMINTNQLKDGDGKIGHATQGKNVRPPSFYVPILFIRIKLVHNYMVDSGATYSIIPNKLVN